MGEKTGEYIFEIVKDSDGVYCYIKQGEIVRCKDCKHRKKNTFCLHNMRYEDDNGFCSYGERGRYER